MIDYTYEDWKAAQLDSEDITHAEAVRDVEHEKHEREQDAWKAQIIGSPVELSQVIHSADNELWINILRNIAHLSDYGLALKETQDWTSTASQQLVKQTCDETIELSAHIKQAIEEYVNG